ncbi:MAG TPA: recombinase family protein [Solirubrobacterales bacterium]|nr:recombinase family protein [Solirubrobacterales bacterium]
MEEKSAAAAGAPLDGYVRVSRVGGRKGEGFISPDVQEQAILDWAKRSGRKVLVAEHELNKSGGTMDRPIFNELMERVRNGESSGIVVYKTDRFARSLLGAVTTLAELGQHNAAFASVTEPQLDYSTPAGQAFLHMLFVFAEFVRATIKESWAISARKAIERGVHISPAPYFGYYKREDGRLIPSPEAPLAIEVFERRGLNREPWAEIAHWLNEVAPRESGQWVAATVQRLCANRVYRGEASRYVKQNIDGRDPIINRDAHPALVSEELWRECQMVRTATGRKDPPALLLSGIVRCAGCRYRMSKGTGPGGEVMYRCRGAHASGQCEERAYIKADAIDDYVEAVFLDGLDQEAEAVPDTADRDEALRLLEEARAATEDFRKDTAARRKLGDAWHEWLDAYLSDERKAEIRVAQITEATATGGRRRLFRDDYLAMPLAERRSVLAGSIDAVMVRRSNGRGRNVDPTPERTRILWRGDAPEDLPRQRRRNAIRPFVFDGHEVPAGVSEAE